ncbi:MAG TPA: hypothetical protein VEB19_05980 [Gemmatimonadaceae bacterium]|nr:hypothetical protein [Gemmatimonadaceae bacterium]
MRLETIPLILGVLIGLIGLGLVLDAWLKDDLIVSAERRKRPRRPRNRFGEALVGFGILAMGAAFVGRDTWPYSTVAVIAGSVLLLWGAWLNSSYFRDLGSRRKPADGATGTSIGGSKTAARPKLADRQQRPR